MAVTRARQIADYGSSDVSLTEVETLDGVTASTSEVNILDGVTSNTAELNILDGVTATTAELNYTDGVTSAIQTQLDGKSPVAGHSSIVTVGTISTGTWNADVIPSAKLDADTAHLSGTQTFSGDKTFTGTSAFGNTALTEGAGLTMLAPTLPTTDHTSTGLSAQMLAGGAIGAFECGCISGTSNEVVISDADAISTMPVIGIAVAAISDAATGTVLLQGFIRDDSWNCNIGGILYASGTAGEMTQTAPSGTGDFVQVLGGALSADVVYFNPSLTLVEVA